jgi:hypothetical protein
LQKPASGNRLRVFSFAFHEPNFLNRTAAAFHGRTISPSSASSQDAPRGALPSEPLLKFAGARECAGTRRGHGPRPHAASWTEIGFAPEMTASIRSCRTFDSDQARPDMTAYLISLALAGLVAIAVWEGLS